MDYALWDAVVGRELDFNKKDKELSDLDIKKAMRENAGK